MGCVMNSNGLITFRHGLAAIAVIWALSAMHRSAVQNSYFAGYAEAQADTADTWAKALQVQQQQREAEFTRQLNVANSAVTALRQANRHIAAREQQLRQEINDVTTHYRQSPAATPEPLPECIFTTGFVGLYNSAISPSSAATATVPTADPAARANRAASTTATAANPTDPLQPSNIGQRDILQHITQYGGRCQSIEAQLNQLLDYLNNLNTKGAA